MATFWTSLVGLSISVSVVTAQNLQLQLTGRQVLSQYVSPSFAGFGIEPSNLFSFTGYSTPNQLTFNLIDNLINYTGAPPHLRIGGNTQDYMVYSPSQTQWTWINNPNPVGQGAYATDSMLIGPRFFQAANRFPQGTPVTWGFNMAYSEPDYIQRLVTMATQVVENTPNLKLVSFEIGNEPDLWVQNGFRTGAWGGPQYIPQWLDRATALYEQVLKPRGIPSNLFEPACTASTIGTSFQVHDLTQLGITAKANNSDTSFLASWNQHDYYYYIGVSSYPLTLDRFMTLTTTKDQFAAWETQIKQAADTGYPYALREMGVVGPIGLEGITNTFGAALWQLNFFMYMASLNITSVQMHQTDNSNASAWQPIEMFNRQPFVRPIYYGIAAFDEIIGRTCQAQVAAYDITAYPENYAGRLGAWSVYQAGQLQTIIVINSNMANVSQSNKASVTVQLTLPSSLAGQTLYLSYLTNTGADATSGTTWNGVSFEKSGNGMPTIVDTTARTVTIGNDGRATLTVRDSQAIAANIGSKLGNTQANASACAALAARSSSALGSTTTSASARSATSSSAASSIYQSISSTASGPTTTSTNGMIRLTAFMSSTAAVALACGALLFWT